MLTSTLNSLIFAAAPVLSGRVKYETPFAVKNYRIQHKIPYSNIYSMKKPLTYGQELLQNGRGIDASILFKNFISQLFTIRNILYIFADLKINFTQIKNTKQVNAYYSTIS